MPKASKKEQQSLYKDHKVQLLISKFSSGEIDALNPVFDPNLGIRYPLVDEVVGDGANANDFLEKLFKGGVLKRKLYDKIIYCPSCNSSNVSIHYTCPHCKSFDIKKSALIEHIKCGYIDTEDKFTKGNKLVCPKCNKELINPDIDHNRAGVWCSCNQCTKSFDIPVPSHFCRRCKEEFSFEEAVYKNVYSYNLSSEAKKAATIGWIMIGPIMELLENLGYTVESPGFLKGKSGTRHMFDLTAVSAEGNNTTVIDLSTSDDVVSEQSVISMFAKIFDTNPDQACLVAIPKMNENGRNLASLYKIELIEAKDQNAAMEALKACISK
jgi:transcription elongation factor Elf1/ATP-dependent Clp protease adapter protein ClpS